MNDALTEMLRGLRLDGVEYGRCRMATPWATAFPEQEAARFHFIGVGQAKLRKPSGEWLTLTCGDAVLLPRGHAHVLGSGEDVTPTPSTVSARRKSARAFSTCNAPAPAAIPWPLPLRCVSTWIICTPSCS